MKIKFSTQNHATGSTLVVTMSVIAVAAIVLSSYLFMVQNETAAAARSQTWNAIIPVAEAGVEEGLALINIGAPIIINAMAWTNSTSANGWGITNGAYIKTNTVSGANYYVVTVAMAGNIPTITSLGVTPITSVPWRYSCAPRPFLAAVGVTLGGTVGNLYREIQVQAVHSPVFNGPMTSKGPLNLGAGTTIDSFNSSSSAYSTLGLYDINKREDHGDVATDASISGDVSLGNANIYGKVYTGPGTAQSAVNVGSQGTVGDATWNANNTGIQPGYWAGDFNMYIPDVSSPATGPLTTLPAPVGGTVYLNGGSYTISPSDPNIGYPLVVTGPTTMWVQGSYNTPAGLTVALTNGANLAVYIGTTSGSGDSLGLGGNGTLNSPGLAANFQLYGLPSLTSITLSGSSDFIGTIYAPDADLTGNGGGSSPDMSGAMVVKSVTLNGHWSFHFDEALQQNGPIRGWIANNWTEIKAPNQ